MRFSDPLGLVECELPLGWAYDPWRSGLFQIEFAWWQKPEGQRLGLQPLPSLAPADAADHEWYGELNRVLACQGMALRTAMRFARRLVALGELSDRQSRSYHRSVYVRGDAFDLQIVLAQSGSAQPRLDGDTVTLSEEVKRLLLSLVLSSEPMGTWTTTEQAVMDARNASAAAFASGDLALAGEAADAAAEGARRLILRDLGAARPASSIRAAIWFAKALLSRWRARGDEQWLPRKAEWMARRALRSLETLERDAEIEGIRSELGECLGEAARQDHRMLLGDTPQGPRAELGPDWALLERLTDRSTWAAKRADAAAEAHDCPRARAAVEEAVGELLTCLAAPYALADDEVIAPLKRAGLRTEEDIARVVHVLSRRRTLSPLLGRLRSLEQMCIGAVDAAGEVEATGLQVTVSRELVDTGAVVATGGGTIGLALDSGPARLIEALTHHAYALLTVGDEPSLAAGRVALAEAEQLLDACDRPEHRAEWCLAAAKFAWVVGDKAQTAELATRGLGIVGAHAPVTDTERQFGELLALAQGRTVPPQDDAGRGPASDEVSHLRRALEFRNRAGVLVNDDRPEDALALVRAGLVEALHASPFSEYVPNLLHVAALCFRKQRTPLGWVGWYMSASAALDVIDARRGRAWGAAVKRGIDESILGESVRNELIEGYIDLGDAEGAVAAADRVRAQVLEQDLVARGEGGGAKGPVSWEPAPALGDPDAASAVIEAASYVTKQARNVLPDCPLEFGDISETVADLGIPALWLQPLRQQMALLLVLPDRRAFLRLSPVPLVEQRQALDIMLSKSPERLSEGAGTSGAAAAEVADPTRGPERLLWRALLEPYVDDLLVDAKRLVVIPFREFSLVPFNLLKDSTGRMLVDRLTIALAPSAATLRRLRSRGEWTRPFPSRAYLVGDPTLTGPLARRFCPLPGALEEAVALARLLRSIGTAEGSVVLRPGDEATEASYRTEAPGSDLVHLACHASIEENPSSSFLALAASRPHDGRLVADEIPDVPLQDALVFLSGCETGRGRPTADGVVGLARAFLEAGARAVVFSLWRVDDQVVPIIARHFYRLMFDTEARLDAAAALSEAMRLARVDMDRGGLRGRDTAPLGSTPSEWGAFTIVGDPWSVRFLPDAKPRRLS